MVILDKGRNEGRTKRASRDPQAIRKALKIEPGSKVTVTLEDDKAIIEKPAFDAVAVFEKIAKEIHYNKRIDPHEYEEELRRAVQTCYISTLMYSSMPQ